MARYFCFLLVFVSVSISGNYYTRLPNTPIVSSYNSLAQTGLIHTPTGSIQESGSVGITLGNSSLNKFISVIATPFDWMEASFFYHRPRDTEYIKLGNYLDKGFNIKFHRKYRNFDFGIGVDDIAGSGLTAKEYVVGTYNGQSFKLTLGLGTGAFSQDHPYKNPISIFEERPGLIIDNGSLGSEIDFDTFFKGPVGLFGGLEYKSQLLPGVTVKIESSPFNYKNFLAGGYRNDKFNKNRLKSKDFNLGVYYKFRNNFSVSVSRIKGNGFDLRVSKKFDYNQKRKKINVKKASVFKKSLDPAGDFYFNLLRNLEKDQLFLQSADLDSKDIELAIVNNRYGNQIDAFKHAAIIVKDLSQQQDIYIETLTLTNVQSGFKTGSMSGRLRNPLNSEILGRAVYTPPVNNGEQAKYKTLLKFPEYYNKISPHLVYRYADPERFMAIGIDLRLKSEVKFSPDLYITTTIAQQITSSFNRLRHKPASALQNVRTDGVKYLNQRADTYITSLQLDRISKLKNNHYLKMTAGLFEEMFGGYGVEYYWKPFQKNLSIGINLYNVKQRNYKQQFKFSKYRVTTGHSNLIYFHNNSGITLDLAIGKYLAGDKGYTLDLSRKFKSGYKMGAYFTRTNISKSDYGEGSFDKGFYFKIPLSIFSESNRDGLSTFNVRPLTRDGGAKLKTENPLIESIKGGSINDYRFYER